MQLHIAQSITKTFATIYSMDRPLTTFGSHGCKCEKFLAGSEAPDPKIYHKLGTWVKLCCLKYTSVEIARINEFSDMLISKAEAQKWSAIYNIETKGFSELSFQKFNNARRDLNKAVRNEELQRDQAWETQTPNADRISWAIN